MQVQSINGVYQYTDMYQAQFLPSGITNDQLNILMKRYNIPQTGDDYTDLKALYTAMYQDIERNGEMQGVQTSAQKEEMIPWASLMSQIGLSATGDYSKDYSNFLNTLTRLQSEAKTPAEKSRLNLVEKMAQFAFVQQQNPVNTVMQLTGAQIVAEMNRVAIKA